MYIRLIELTLPAQLIEHQTSAQNEDGTIANFFYVARFVFELDSLRSGARAILT